MRALAQEIQVAQALYREKVNKRSAKLKLKNNNAGAA